MKKLLSLSFAVTLSLIGFWCAPAQAMCQQNSVSENIEKPGDVLVEEIVGYKNEYTSVSNPGVIFTPTYTPWGMFYKHLEHKNGRWQLEPREHRIVWRRQVLGRAIYMAPAYSCMAMDKQMQKAGLHSRNTYDPYADIYGRD